MAATSVVITRARDLLNDTGAVAHWTDAELLRWVSDAQRDIVTRIPVSNVTIESLTLTASTSEQDLTSITNVYRLIDVIRNTHDVRNKVIFSSTEVEMSLVDPGWHIAPANSTATVERYVYSVDTPTIVHVYPNPTSDTQIQLKVSKLPLEIALVSTELTLDDSYIPLMVDYTVARAFSKDSDFADSSASSVSSNKYEVGIETRTGG